MKGPTSSMKMLSALNASTAADMSPNAAELCNYATVQWLALHHGFVPGALRNFVTAKWLKFLP